MLTFSKEREPVPEASDLNDVAGDVAELMKTRAEDEGVKLHWEPAPTMPTLMFDPEAMHRAILNVVTNAVDACHDSEAGRVTISTRYDDKERMARVRVEDNGSGIEKDDLEKIFSVFVSRKGGRGTGLGLPVSQKILQEHGGSVRVESQVGQGSCFTIEFPATTPHGSGSERPGQVRGSTNIDHAVADPSQTAAGSPQT
jgi:signal transduction histidine kinase